MKEILDEESRKALIAYRLQRAYETLKEAEVMIRESFYNAAVNRMYYACYYAAVALLLKYDIQTQTHNGVKTMLGLHFISTGKLSLKIGKTFSTPVSYTLSLKRGRVVTMMTLSIATKAWSKNYTHRPACS